MKKMNLIVATALVLASSSVMAAETAAYNDSWYVMPGLNLIDAGQNVDAENSNLGYSLKIGKPISEHIDIQAGFSHNRPDEDSSRFTNGNYRQNLLGVDAVYIFDRQAKFTPILIGGGGLAYNKIAYSTPGGGSFGGRHYSWMANVGAGFQYAFNDRVSLQTDVRRVWSDAEYNSDRHTVANDYLNVGVIFRFGAAQKVAALAPVAEPTPAPVTPAPQPVQEAQTPTPTPVPVTPPVFEKVTLSSEVLFDFDRTALKEQGKTTLNTEVVDKMKAHPEVELVLITGHTDRIGSDIYNQKLSEQRAKAVKAYLVAQGVEETRLHTKGAGEAEPVVECDNVKGKTLKACLAPNRRVVVEIEQQAK